MSDLRSFVGPKAPRSMKKLHNYFEALDEFKAGRGKKPSNPKINGNPWALQSKILKNYKRAGESVFGLPVNQSMLYDDKPILPSEEYPPFEEKLKAEVMECFAKDQEVIDLLFAHQDYLLPKLKTALLNKMLVGGGLRVVKDEFWAECIQTARDAATRRDSTNIDAIKNTQKEMTSTMNKIARHVVENTKSSGHETNAIATMVNAVDTRISEQAETSEMLKQLIMRHDQQQNADRPMFKAFIENHEEQRRMNKEVHQKHEEQDRINSQTGNGRVLTNNTENNRSRRETQRYNNSNAEGRGPILRDTTNTVPMAENRNREARYQRILQMQATNNNVVLARSSVDTVYPAKAGRQDRRRGTENEELKDKMSEIKALKARIKHLKESISYNKKPVLPTDHSNFSEMLQGEVARHYASKPELIPKNTAFSPEAFERIKDELKKQVKKSINTCSDKLILELNSAEFNTFIVDFIYAQAQGQPMANVGQGMTPNTLPNNSAGHTITGPTSSAEQDLLNNFADDTNTLASSVDDRTRLKNAESNDDHNTKGRGSNGSNINIRGYKNEGQEALRDTTNIHTAKDKKREPRADTNSISMDNEVIDLTHDVQQDVEEKKVDSNNNDDAEEDKRLDTDREVRAETNTYSREELQAAHDALQSKNADLHRRLQQMQEAHEAQMNAKNAKIDAFRSENEAFKADAQALRSQNEVLRREKEVSTFNYGRAVEYASSDYENIVKIVPGPSEETNDEVSMGDIENGMVQTEPNSPDLR